MASKSYDGIWKHRESLVSGEKTTPFQSGMNYNMQMMVLYLAYLPFPFEVLLITEEYFRNKHVLIFLYFLLLYSDSLMAVYYGTMIQKVQHSKSKCKQMFIYFQTCYFKTSFRHTLGSFGRTFGSPLKNCDFCRLSL